MVGPGLRPCRAQIKLAHDIIATQGKENPSPEVDLHLPDLAHLQTHKPRPLAVWPEELRAIRRAFPEGLDGLGILGVIRGEAFPEHRGMARIVSSSTATNGGHLTQTAPSGGLPN